MIDWEGWNREEKVLREEMEKNPEYLAWKKDSDAHERNRITNEVNGCNASFRNTLSPGAAAYFDYLWKTADLDIKYGGDSRAVWDMEELEW